MRAYCDAPAGWIYDAELHAAEVEQGARLPPGLSTEAYVNSHPKRAQGLSRRGIIEPLGEDRFRVPTDFKARVEAASAAGRDQGTVTKVERLAARDLDGQVGEEGVTWLDQ